LGEEYLGLSSLFSSVLQVLNVAELGFSASIIYFMYKPLAESDIDRVCALLAYMKKVYRIIGIIILSVGIMVMPFLPYIIKSGVPADINVYLLYLLYLLNTCISYFLFSYKTALLTALQRLDLTKVANTVIIVIQYALQLMALLCFHNFYLYVIALILGTGFSNIFIAWVSTRKFPQYMCRGRIEQSTKRDIISKIKGLMICNISAVTYTSFDSIIISTVIGLRAVAIYNNYILISSSINSLILSLRTSMQASVGNSIVSESRDKNLKDMELWRFLFSIIGIWCSTCLICLYQPFMRLWMGEGMLLPMIDVALIGVWGMITNVLHAQHLYTTGNGMWNEMKYSYIFSTCFNLVMNIILGKIWGIAGIIIASVLSISISGLWQCIILFKCYFKMSAKSYMFKYFLYLGEWAVVASVTYLACSFFAVGGLSELVIKAAICIIVPGVLIFCISFRTKYFSQAKSLFMNIIHK
jgi:O-antigen/teichoic acid export membrane protein